MARSSGAKGPTRVEATIHQNKRVNIPTADAHDFMPPDQTIPQVIFERDPSLDPQLVWRDKYKGYPTQLVADAPPIYIQEKIDPRVLVENLQKTSKASQPETEPSLFDDFDGLGELDSVDFYRHHANWSNRIILGDSLQVMASLAEREALRGQVQMIYVDPPYGIKFGSNWQVSTKDRDVRDGKATDAAREAEQIKAFRDTWELGIHSYLSYLRDRLITVRDLMTESGSCFVQIGDENVHLVRNIMDEVFGPENFVSLITLRKTSSMNSPMARVNSLPNTADFLIWYAKSIALLKFRQPYQPKTLQDAGGDHYRTVLAANGDIRQMTAEEAAGLKPLGKDDRAVQIDNLISQGQSDSLSASFMYDGRTFTPPRGSHWKTTLNGLEGLARAGRLSAVGRTLRYRRFFDDFPVMSITNIWADVGSDADKIYVVQTASRAIERCMLMCTDPGDLVLDPTCGSGTTAHVAEQWGRRWITIDTSRVALALARQRLMGASYPYYLLADSQDGRKKESEASGQMLPPAQTSNDIRQGFVYERVQHITLKSIANNPDIVEGMTRAQIDAAIKRHADFELLYDKPYVDNRKVRVSGPFTVESLSPHRSLTFAPPPEGLETKAARFDEASWDEATWSDFDQSILENLQKAGIQNGRRKDRLEFTQLEPYAGKFVQAIGTPRSDEDGQPLVAIAVGPQYGTVDAQFIKNAAKEAVIIDNVGILAVLGFAFDPQAVNLAGKDDDQIDTSDTEFAVALGERTLGKLRLLPVRMNVDLLMGDALKKTGAGNLFTVFGEPDIKITRTEEGQVVVELRGVDVYDPATGEVRSNDTDKIALWMIDSDYNGESFFIRHCYFTGGNDPYKRLKTALKADISEEAWQTLHSTTSIPFDPPSTDKIAVKVINDYGDEVMQVFEVQV